MKLGSLGIKFSLLLALVWLFCGGATIFTLSRHLNAQAEQTVKERAEIVLTAMQAARNYTQDNIQPLVEAYSVADNSFTQEIIPNFAARSIFSNFRQQDPSLLDYLYKEAAVNPTNTADLADSFEAKLYPQLEPITDTPPETVSGYRTLNEQKFFYLAKPLVVEDESCLACHGNSEEAPAPLINLYGDRNGFGWNLNEIVATQMVYVPADMIFARGRQNLWTVTKTLLGIFGALFCTINLLLWRTVIRPLKILTGTAKQISECPLQINQPEINQPKINQPIAIADKQLIALTLRKDEPGQMARAFEYMLYVLSQREKDLQLAVEERTRSLRQEMRDRQTAQSALQIYAHAMNHDLRNVAMGISSVVQGILFRTKQTEYLQTPQLRVDPEAISLIQQSCDRQLQLMDNLMEVRSADVWRAALRPTALNFHTLADKLITTYRTKFATDFAAKLGHETKFTITHQIPSNLPTVSADSTQIQRVFDNLICNAIKYNPNGVDIVLSASVQPPLDSNFDSHSQTASTFVRCTVTDKGKGIDPNKHADLFTLYTRGQQDKPSAQTDKGYGLGLYICREIVSAHGGQIGVEESQTGGATFWFTLPISPSD
ncbi:MAG: DUF3365 domain-containing protein [Cyanobacteria bacterium J06621_11]